MKKRYHSAAIWNRFQRLVLVALFLFAGTAAPAQAQDEDDYHQFIRSVLEEDYELTGGDFILGSDEQAVIDILATRGIFPSSYELNQTQEDLPFTNYWTVTIPSTGTKEMTWVTSSDVDAGDVLLAAQLIRGESDQGETALASFQFGSANIDGDGSSLNQSDQDVSFEWELKLLPFEAVRPYPSGEGAYRLQLSQQLQTVEVAPPVVINFGRSMSIGQLNAALVQDPNAPLEARMSADPPRGAAPLTVLFNGGGSVSPAEVTAYDWTFGDGNTGSGSVVEHTYETGGLYDVSLIVTDARGERDTTSQAVYVFDGVGLPESPLEIPYTSVVPELDGEPDDLYADAASIAATIHVTGIMEPDSPSDLSATAHFVWDASYLYAYFEVDDDQLVNDSQDAYQDDSVELYLDGENEKCLQCYDENDEGFTFSYGDTTGVTEEAMYANSETEDGYIIEARIPWNALNTYPVPDKRIGLEFGVNDDDGTNRETKLHWYSLQDQAYQWASEFGTAVLTGGENEVLVAVAEASVGQALAGEEVTFSGAQSYGATSHTWNFGDGETADGPEATHAYAERGRYMATLTVEGNGMTAVDSVAVIVVDPISGDPVFWSFDGAEPPMTMDAYYGFDLALEPGVVVGDGRLGQALVLDGSAAAHAVDEEAGGYLNGLSAITIAFWSKSNSADTDSGFFFDHEPSGGDDGVGFRYDAAGWATGCTACLKGSIGVHDAEGNPNGVSFESAASGIQTTEWQHLAYTWSSGEPIRVFVDGEEVELVFGSPDNAVGTIQGVETFYIGRGGKDEDRSWDGMIDEFYIFPRALQQDEVQLLMEGNLNVATEESDVPERFAIESIYPNPFNPRATARLALPHSGDYNVRIFNVLGQVVEQRTLEMAAPGRMELPLELGRFASGIYFLRVEHQASGKIVEGKALLLK